MRVFLVFALLLCPSFGFGFSSSEICVRDWGEFGCENSDHFEYVMSVKGDILCARSFEEHMCEYGEENNFFHVLGEEGQLFCTTNYDSPRTPYCYTDPENFQWVKLP